MKISRKLMSILFIVACLIAFGYYNAQAGVLVYDADGQFLGIFLGSDNGAEIYIPSSDININISYSNGDAFRNVLFFESSDCSGTPYVNPNVSYYIVKNGEKYYTGEKIAPINVQFKSRLSQDGLSCIQYSSQADLVPAEEVIPSITLPVALPLNFELKKIKKYKKHHRF